MNELTPEEQQALFELTMLIASGEYHVPGSQAATARRALADFHKNTSCFEGREADKNEFCHKIETQLKGFK